VRLIRFAALALLGAWCAIGVWDTARALAGPAGWVAGRPAADSGFVGMPLPGAGAVAATTRLLGAVPRAQQPALVLLPAGVDPTLVTYIRYQLAHLRYPQRVEVVAAGVGEEPRGEHGVVVTAPGIRLDAPWRAAATLADFAVYVREEP